VRHWLKRVYWLWFWRRRVPFGVKATTVGVLLCGLLMGGWAAASGVTSSGGSNGSLVLETTVEKLSTVHEHEHERIIRKFVPVTVTIKTSQRRATVYRTEPKYISVPAPASAGARTHTVTRLIPEVITRDITISGKPDAAASTRPGTSRPPQNVTLTQTVTTSRDVTQPAVTVATTQTNTRTETQIITTTRTQIQTVTQTQTVTITVTTTPKK
jgi:hypothetical protein